MVKTNIYSIVVTHNGQYWIKKCLNSLKSSSITNQIIVIDNNSTDSTVKIIKEDYPDVKLICNPKNIGFGRANNMGIKEAISKDAEYILLLNQDAWIQEDTIRILNEILVKHPKYGLLSPIHLSGKMEIDSKFRIYLTEEFTPHYLKDDCNESLKEIYETRYVNAACWFLPKSTFEKVGQFEPLFHHYGEDDNFITRCEYHNIKLGINTGTYIIHDREQKIAKIGDFEYSKLVNYMRNHILIDLLNTNINYLEKLKRFFIHVLKGFYRNPFAVIQVLCLLLKNSLRIISSYKKSKVPYSHSW